MNVFQTITEGGQLATHSIRMFKQVTKTSILIALLLWISGFVYQMKDIKGVHFEFYLQSIRYYGQANLYQFFGIKTMYVDTDFWSKLGGQRMSQLPVTRVISATKPYADRFFRLIKLKLKSSALFALVPLFFVLALFFFRGRRSSKKHCIKGNQLASSFWVSWKLKLTRRASKISIGPLPLVKGTETQHVLITGGTGSGKTNCLHHILKSIRDENQRAIIVDTTGVLTDYYYRHGKDIILNPMDSRGAPWNPWIECKDKTSYAAMAESFIPHSFSDGDNYWRTSARIVLSSILEQLEGVQKNTTLTETILRIPLRELCEIVIGTKAASVIDISSEKTAASIRSVLSSFLTCFEYLRDVENPFSVRNWIQQKSQSGEWLFLNCKTNQRAALNPLLACWFSIAVRSLLELEPDFNRRVWFIIDELPTLNRLRDLETLLAESRKYGGCGILALQSPAQLDAIYGQSITQTITGNCATKIVFSEQNPLNAGRIAEMFGEQEIQEYQKSLSYGANDIRDGVSLNQRIHQQALITKTDIQFLQRNNAFVRLPDNNPIVTIKIPIIKREG